MCRRVEEMPEFWITGDTKPGSSDEITSELDNNVIQYFRGVVRFQIYDVQQAKKFGRDRRTVIRLLLRPIHCSSIRIHQFNDANSGNHSTDGTQRS